ncbi:MAG: DUF2934 domain-containing protein [Candidatus Omnitrophica bacterium]|nr:DUF2934 domain-containing protein [Candidatus Omnitrophota bacterium]
MGEDSCYKDYAEQCIKKKAYELWEKDGCKPGCDQDYWLIAEKSVKVLVKIKNLKNQKSISEG